MMQFGAIPKLEFVIYISFIGVRVLINFVILSFPLPVCLFLPFLTLKNVNFFRPLSPLQALFSYLLFTIK